MVTAVVAVARRTGNSTNATDWARQIGDLWKARRKTMEALQVVLEAETLTELQCLRRDKVFRNWFEIEGVDPQYPLTICGEYSHAVRCGGVADVLVRKLEPVFESEDRDIQTRQTQEVFKQLKNVCIKHGLPVPTWTSSDGAGQSYDFDRRDMVDYAPPFALLRHLGFWGSHGYDEEGHDENGIFHPCRWVKRLLTTEGMTPARIKDAFAEWEDAFDDDELAFLAPLSIHAALA